MDSQYYQSTTQDVWQGRNDEPNSRIFQQIQCVDLNSTALSQEYSPRVALLGFCSDEGVRRNLGRVGAALGPAQIRQYLGNYPLTAKTSPLWDGGDIIVSDGNLEAGQQALGELVFRLQQQKALTVILGGGHEVSWAHFQGLSRANKTQKMGIINFDAHFDLRPLLPDGKGSSGTSFTQIALQQKKSAYPFHYLCLGVQPGGNTHSLFQTADEVNCQYILAEQFFHDNNWIMRVIDEFIEQCDTIYCTICMDVFSQSVAPGVSAPQPLGLMPWHVIPLLKKIAASPKLIAVDVAELSPPFDQSHQTARLAASLLGMILAQFFEQDQLDGSSI